MTVLRWILFLILLSSLASIDLSQEITKQTAFVFREIGPSKTSVLSGIMSDFVKAIRAKGNVQGYVFNYGSNAQIALRRKALARGIPCCDQIDPSRITFLNVGSANKLKTVFWIVPDGSEVPKP